MADDKTTKTPEQPVTDSGPGKETPPAPPKEPEKVSVSPEPEKKTEPVRALLFYGSTILPFVDHFPKNTELYRIMTTKPQELKKKEDE